MELLPPNSRRDGWAEDWDPNWCNVCSHSQVNASQNFRLRGGWSTQREQGNSVPLPHTLPCISFHLTSLHPLEFPYNKPKNVHTVIAAYTVMIPWNYNRAETFLLSNDVISIISYVLLHLHICDNVDVNIPIVLPVAQKHRYTFIVPNIW